MVIGEDQEEDTNTAYNSYCNKVEVPGSTEDPEGNLWEDYPPSI